MEDGGIFAAVIEPLDAGELRGVATLGASALAATPEALRRYDPGAASADLDDRGLALYAAAALDLAGGAVDLLATDEGLQEIAGQATGEPRLAPSPIQDLLPAPPDRIVGAGGDLWLQAGGRLYAWRGGELSEITAGEPRTGPLAAGGVYGGLPVIWAAGDASLVALSRGGWEVVAEIAAEDLGGAGDGAGDSAGIGAVGTDRDGALWAIRAGGGDLLRIAPEGDLSRYALPAPARWVGAHPEAAGAWALTDAGLYRVEGGEAAAYALADTGGLIPEPGAVDRLGRLVFASEGGLWRVGRSRVLLLTGLTGTAAAPEEIAGAREVRAVATLPEEIATLEAWIDGEPLALDGDTATVLASGWADGRPHTLRAAATWQGGESAEAEAVFTSLDVGVVTWAGQIGPLYEAECALCHGGGTETILDTPEAWEARIDDILANVRSGAMPLGRDPLSAVEVATIEAWQAGGFLSE